MIAADIIRNLFCIFKVDCIVRHTDCKRADRLVTLCRSNGANERAVKTAAEKKSHLCIGNKALFYSSRKLIVNAFADCFNVIINDLINRGYITVAHKFFTVVKMSRGERHDFIRQRNKVFRLARKHDFSALVISVKQRTDAYRVTGGDKLSAFSVIYNHCKFRVKHIEHIRSVFAVKRQDNLAVRVAFKAVALAYKLLFHFSEAVQLTVAYAYTAVKLERLHSLRVQAHNCKPVECHNSARHI